MKRIFFLLCLGVASLYLHAETQSQSDWPQFQRYKQQNEQLKSNPKVVFMGNSITDGWWTADSLFFTTHQYACRGISGQVTAQMLLRFRQDVINLKPKKVVILAGTNDIARNSYYVSIDHVMENIAGMCDLAKANHIRVVLCTVLPSNKFYWNPTFDPTPQLLDLNNRIRTYARANHLTLVDFYPLFADEQGALPSQYSADGVHPNKEAYKIMEQALLKVL